MSFIANLQVTHNDDATKTIAGEIPYTELEKHREAAIEHLGKDIVVSGFRPGHVPTEMLVEKIGEMNILSEMAERALANHYPQMLADHQIDAIGYPQVSITKIAPDNPLGFTITVGVVPEFTLPDYREIAAAHQPENTTPEVTDEDIETATKDVIRRKVAYDRIQQKAAAQAQQDTNSTDLPTPETINQPKDEGAPVTDEELPPLTDELAKELGGFTSVDEFKAKVREELTEQRAQEAQTKHRATVSDALIAATNLTVPQVMVDAEIEQFMAQMQDDLKRAQLSFEEYLSHIKKTEEELKKEWKPSAEKRAKIQLILNAIADAEEITPDETVVSEQVATLKARYSDADEARIRTYVISVLRNEAVMQLLEGKAADESEVKEQSAAAKTKSKTDESGDKSESKEETKES